jgi:hypothetical protein
MAWPYHFVTLTDAQVNARRQALDRAGLTAHLSVLVPILVLVVVRFGQWIAGKSVKSDYGAIPGSPLRKAERSGNGGKVLRVWRRASWWLEEEVLTGWGERKFWLAGVTWWCWLIVVCVRGTGDGKLLFPYYNSFDMFDHLDMFCCMKFVMLAVALV